MSSRQTSHPRDDRPPARGALIALAVISVLTLGTDLGVSLIRYLSYSASAYDLGFFDQVTERTAAGHPWQSTFVAYSFLGQHFEPVLWLPAQLDKLTPTPIWLLLIQSIALGLAPIAAWRLGRRWLGGDVAPLAAAILTALSPLLLRGAEFDFHAEALTTVLALVALERLAAGRTLVPLLAVASLCVVKEDAILVAVGVGWITLWADRRFLGIIIAAAAAVAFAVIVGSVMPGYRMGAPGDLNDRFRYLGGTTLGEQLRGAARHPGRVWGQLTKVTTLQGWAVALIPVGLLLPLVAGPAVLGALLPLMVPLLSDSADQSRLLYHYGLESFPLLLACSLLGWRRIRGPLGHRLGPRAEPGVAALLIGASLFTTVLAVIPPWRAAFGDRHAPGLSRRHDVESVLAAVPSDAEVSASSGLVPHLSNRATVFEFPGGFGSRVVVIDDKGPISQQALDDGFFRRERELPGAGYHIVKSAGGVTLWVR